MDKSILIFQIIVGVQMNLYYFGIFFTEFLIYYTGKYYVNNELTYD